MESKSLWQTYSNKINFDKIQNNINVDVLVIGGGITGISTAYHLLDTGLSVCVVEKNKIASGVTLRTTGKLTYLQDMIYTKLNNNYSFCVAYNYYKSQKEAIEIVESIVKKHRISCDFQKSPSVLFTNKKCETIKLRYEKYLLERMNVEVKENIKIPYQIENSYNIAVFDTYTIHPLKYVYKLAHICSKKGVTIFENTCVFDIKKNNDIYECIANDKKIYAKHVVFCGHYPYFLKPFIFPIKTHLKRSYITSSKIEDRLSLNGINTSKKSLSFRFWESKKEKQFIFLTNSHDLAFKYNISSNFNKHLQKLSKMNFRCDYMWSNTDIITPDNMPYIGKLKNNLYIATGYNAWGMTNGSLAGKIISDLITGRKNKYTSLFSPLRIMPFVNFFQYFYNMFCSIKPYINNKVIKNKKYYKPKVVFKKLNGKDVGIYIDKNNKRHIVYNKCPHLKCNLIFNEVELTWDCPCHSSRFDLDGKCIKGPSNYDITYKKD